MGPGAARNQGAHAARGEWLAFTEDDVTPDDDWLACAAARIASAPGLDVIEGLTVKPGGRPVPRQSQEYPLYLPTNLFVRRELFLEVGGYCEAFFDRGIYFREDADFGFVLERHGAHVARDPAIRVEHPDEHAGFLDPLRWARRHEMDPLLAARHPRAFRERVEVHRLGPFEVHRPIVRASVASALCGIAAVVAWALGGGRLALLLTALALLATVPLVFKWRNNLARLPVILLVPYVMLASLVRGQLRARRIHSPEIAR